MGRIRKIVAGAQTGVSRAALDFAVQHRFPYSGYVPQGGRTDDFPHPPGLLAVYGDLREHLSVEDRPSIEANIRCSDATAILGVRRGHPGLDVDFALAVLQKQRRPQFRCETGSTAAAIQGERLRVTEFLDTFNSDIALNVIGPNERNSPGIYNFAHEWLSLMVVGLLA
ncbi:MAG: hypothetical protein JWM55_2115 [Acidimicrobiaceae bacterium]|nr:hypothetical protein [Acidimicrobiaceae bacterium]